MAFTSFSLHYISESKLQIRSTERNPRPHPVKLNNLPKYKATLRPQTGRQARPRASPSYTLPTWLLFQNQETSHSAVPLPPHAHTCTQKHTRSDPTNSPIRLCHAFPFLISAPGVLLHPRGYLDAIKPNEDRPSALFIVLCVCKSYRSLNVCLCQSSVMWWWESNQNESLGL